MHDSWGSDRNTGARGLTRGIRTVKNGAVKIGGDMYHNRYGKLIPFEGKKVAVHVTDCWATEYDCRDLESGAALGPLKYKP